MSAPIVLVVEDHQGARKLAQAALESAGYAVSAAADAKTALALLESERPGLILLDLVLPDMDGFELAPKLRASERGAGVPIVACSGFLPREEQGRIASAGFDDFLVKPVSPGQLVETVARYLPLPETAAAPGKLRRRILVVDDDPVQRRLLRARLELHGFDVEVTESGEEALALAARETFDAIASDVLMPGLNGFGLCLAARRDPDLEQVPIILFSASYLEPEDCQVARSVGADAFVLRTPDFRELVDALEGSLVLKSRPRDVHDHPTPRRAPINRLPAETSSDRLLQRIDKEAALNARLVQDATVQAAALTILGSVSDALARRDELDNALADALACCLEASAIDAGAVFALDGEALRVRAQSGFDDAGEVIARLEESLTATFLDRVLSSEAPVPLPDPTRTGLVSALVAPLVLRGERLGLLVLASSERDISGEEWRAFARPLAAQIALALGLARSFERLRASEERRRSLLASAHDAIFVLDARGVVLEANHGAERLLRRPAAEITGTRLEPLATLIASGARLVETELEAGPGKYVRVSVSSSPVDLPGRRETICIARDLSHVDAASAEQARLYGEANRALRARDEFLATAGDELKRPLRTLAEQLGGPEREQVERLVRLVDLVTFAFRAAEDEPVPGIEDVDLAALVREGIDRVAPEAAARGVELAVRAPAELKGRWDPARIEGLVGILLSNALRRAEGRKVAVELEAEDGHARLRVGDGAPGIASADPAATLDCAPTGLGLWAARRIAETQGGSLAVATRTGWGSAVTVTLPV